METRDRQTKSLYEREKILQEIERDKLAIEKEMESARQKKNEFRLILDDQKSARDRDKINEKFNLQNDMKAEKEEEMAYEQFLREEARRMRLNGVTPRVRIFTGLHTFNLILVWQALRFDKFGGISINVFVNIFTIFSCL